MPLAELYPYVDNSDMKGPDFAAYERMTNSLCHRMGIGETEKRRDQVFAILAQDRGAASLTASLDEGFPDSTNIVTQIQWPIGVQLKGHMFLVMHARDHVGGLIIAAGRTDRLLDQDVGQEPHKLHVRRKIEELMRRDNITQDQVQQIIVKGPVARWTSTTAWGEVSFSQLTLPRRGTDPIKVRVESHEHTSSALCFEKRDAGALQFFRSFGRPAGILYSWKKIGYVSEPITASRISFPNVMLRSLPDHYHCECEGKQDPWSLRKTRL